MELSGKRDDPVALTTKQIHTAWEVGRTPYSVYKKRVMGKYHPPEGTEQHRSSIVDPEDGCRKLLRIVGKTQPTASSYKHPRPNARSTLTNHRASLKSVKRKDVYEKRG